MRVTGRGAALAASTLVCTLVAASAAAQTSTAPGFKRDMLGNLVPQLHVHVIARFQDDIAWPRPVWGTAAAKPYSEEALVRRIEALRAALAG